MGQAEIFIRLIRSVIQQKGCTRAVFSMNDAHNMVPDFIYENLKLEVESEDDLIVIDDSGVVHYISVGTMDMKAKDPNEPGDPKKA